MKIVIYSEACLRCGINGKHRRKVNIWANQNKIAVQEKRIKYDMAAKKDYERIVNDAGIQPDVPIVVMNDRVAVLSEAIYVLPQWLEENKL